jgi:hypothetical protein
VDLTLDHASAWSREGPDLITVGVPMSMLADAEHVRVLYFGAERFRMLSRRW